ncbi:MAG TPA: amidohydrolase family protein [Bryobacterales bacterium]|nr:amidohydrolase family protein [Bryobacterales bacterium]
MTRRQLFALIPAAALPRLRAAEAGFVRIDTHTHIHRKAPVLLAAMGTAGWKGLSICDSRAMGDEPSGLAEMIRGTVEACRESGGRLSWATTFDARDFESREFADRVIAGLGRDCEQGAVGVKIWKNIGMGIRSKSGEYLMPDNAAFTPIFDAIQRAGKTLIAHLADPNASWSPHASLESAYLKSHPEWIVYGRPGAPAKEAILAARDRILERHPKLRVIGCHLGSNEEDLDRLGKRLDAHPNFAVDVAARVRFLAREDRERVRQFLLKYADRILYATDFTLGAGNDDRAAQSFLAQHDQEWSFFSTGGTLGYRGREIQGLALSEKLLRKIFHDNAARWLPGIAA